MHYRKTGKALTFITRENWKWARELCNILAQAEQVRVQPIIRESIAVRGMKSKDYSSNMSEYNFSQVVHIL